MIVYDSTQHNQTSISLYTLLITDVSTKIELRCCGRIFAGVGATPGDALNRAIDLVRFDFPHLFQP